MQPWAPVSAAQYPRRDPVPPGRLVLQLAIAAIAGGTAGTALVVFVRAWMLLHSRVSSCDHAGDSPFPSGACLNGIGPVLGWAFLVTLAAGVLTVVLLFRRGRIRRVVVAIAFVAGALAGQPLLAVPRGPVLPVAWTAPGDPTARLATAGAWTAGGSLIRVRTDQVLSYDAATGRVRWTLPLLGGFVPCAVSDPSASAIGLVGYGQMDGACDHVLAIDLRAGRPLWSTQVPPTWGLVGEQPTGGTDTSSLAVAGQTAVLRTSSDVIGLDARSGARRWLRAAAPGCTYLQVAASARVLVAAANCSSATSVTALDPATGRQAWQALLPGGSGPAWGTILSVSPVVIGSPGQGANGSLLVRVLGPDGAVAATFPADLVRPRTYGNGGFPSPVTVAGGLLVGLADPAGYRADGSLTETAVTAYRLSDGRPQWRDAVPAGVADVAFAGGEAVIIDESGPDYSLRAVSLGTGHMRPLGHIPPDDLDVGSSGLYAVAGHYLVVNWAGDPSVAAFAVPHA
jgi:outer membrane protein assembly factor BamB